MSLVASARLPALHLLGEPVVRLDLAPARPAYPEAEAALREASEQLQAGFGDNGPSLAYGAGLLGRTLSSAATSTVHGRRCPCGGAPTLVRTATR